MANKANFKFKRGSTVRAKQHESSSVSNQSFRVKKSDFDEVRAKFRQIGKGKQTMALTSPLIGRRNVVIRRKDENG